jgi:dihydrolipoamide dehydrogenase
MNFDVVVIGSGPGGYICAIRCAQLGLKVAIIERYKSLGGTCLNVGCIPSKAWLDSSEKFFELNHTFKDHGITSDAIKLDFKKMSSRVQDVVKQTSSGVDYLMKKNKITVFSGHGSFVDANTVKVEGEKTETLTAKNIVIATGSKPSTLPGVTIDKERIITSTEALKLPELPKRLVVIGGGVIGLEMSSVFSRLGSEVTVVEYASNIIPTMDLSLGSELMKVMKKEGVKFLCDHAVKTVTRNKNTVKVVADDKASGKPIEIEADYCLVAVGRRPYTDKLNLAAAKVEMDERGRIKTNDHLQTNVAHIYAIGDVVKGAMLAHKAEEEGVVVAELIAGQKPHINYNLIPGVVYTWPEVAGVGQTEEQLKAANIPYKSGSYPFKALGRARASNENYGFVKVLAHKETDEVLGIHMIGPRCADIIGEAVLAMEYRASAEDIARTSHAHPTYSEALKEAALAATGNRALNI